MGRTIGKSTSRVLSTEEWSQAHLYVLTNCEEVTSFIEEHKQSIRVKPRIRARDVYLIHTREFISWFEEHEMSLRRGRVQIVSPEHELDNLQQLLDIQPAATTTPSSSNSSDSSDPSDPSDPFVVGSSSSKKRTRGPTCNLDLLSMKPGEKKNYTIQYQRASCL
eukprot:XP_010664898.1 PREDICTED: uncharacterized protein LOC104882589 [Vitis vinifera]